MRHCFALLWVFVSMLAGVVASAMTLAPMMTGPLSERWDDAPADTSELINLYAHAPEGKLKLTIVCAGELREDDRWGIFVLFDTDLNPRTGFSSGPLGVDHLAQIQPAQGDTLLIHRRRAGNDNKNFQGWESQEKYPNAVKRSTYDGSGRITLEIPLAALGLDPANPIVRWRICTGAPELNPEQGDWAPDLPEAFFSLGQDPRRWDTLKSELKNGDFEAINTALASTLPTDWGPFQAGPQTTVQSVDRPVGKHALRIASKDGQAAGMNGTPVAARRGVVTFKYFIDKSSVEGRNLGLQIIGLSGAVGQERYRFNWSPPAAHVGDGQWHEAAFDYRLPAGLEYALVAPRVNENTPASGAADWTLDDINLYPIPEGVSVSIANAGLVDATNPSAKETSLLRTGESKTFLFRVENTGGVAAEGYRASLRAEGVGNIKFGTLVLGRIEPGAFASYGPAIHCDQPGTLTLQLTLSPGPGAQDDFGVGTRELSYPVLVVDAKEPLDRRAINTDEQGFWRRLAPPAQLQQGNAAEPTAIPHKTSREIGRNTFGICMQIPRARDYETPFDPAHLIDDDPATCWSSMQRNNAYPLNAPKVHIKLSKPIVLSRLNLIPYWQNSDFPRGFTVLGLVRSNPQLFIEVQSTELTPGSEMRGDKYVQSFAPNTTQTVPCQEFIISFNRLPPAGGNYAEVSSGWKARLAGIELIDEHGNNVALASLGATVTASDTFTGWQNLAANIEQAYKQVFNLGLKWVRIGQWGDQTEWAAVERTKGVYKMDPRTDAAISEMVDNGVDILYGLQYGNHLYNDVNDNPENKPWGDIGPIFNEGSPFNRNNGPRTPAARAAFVNYVDWVVRNYKDKVKFWELWNEQNGWYPDNEPDLYGMLLADVGKKIKQIDPTAKFSYGGTAAPAPITTEIALRHGGAPYIDITAFHPYGIEKPEGGIGTNEAYQGKPLGKSIAETGWKNLEDIIAGVRAPFAQHGRPDVEVWMNEFGGNVSSRNHVYNPGISEYASAKQLLRLYTYGGWNNARVAWWALHTDNNSQDWGILDPETFELRPMALALRNLCSTLSDVTPIIPSQSIATLTAPGVADPKCISFARDGDSGETLTAIWAADMLDGAVKSYPASLEIAHKTKPATVRLIDLYWGLEQPANWQWDAKNKRLRIEQLVLRDYPVVVSVQ